MPCADDEEPAVDRDPLTVDVNDFLLHRLGRRALFGSAAALAGGLLVGCGSGDDKSYVGGESSGAAGAGGSGGASRPKPTGTIQPGKANIPTPRDQTVIIGQVDMTTFDNWNSMVPNGAALGSGFFTVAKEYMFYLNLATGELLPWLATGYKYNDASDQLTITFDPKVTWSDRKPMTANDFAFTLLLKRDNPELIGGGGDLKTYVKDVKVTDPQTAVISMSKPNPRLHYMFIATIVDGFDILPQHIWKGQDPLKFKDPKAIRTGSYKLKQVIPSQKMFVWERNPQYWNTAKLNPKPQYVVYTSINEQADAASLAFERAQFDVGSLDDPHAQALMSKGYPAIAEAQFRDPCPRGFWVNCDPARGIIGEPKVRQALALLVNREKIGSQVVTTPAPPAQWPWADYKSNKTFETASIAKEHPMRYDPAAAAKLLDEVAPKGADGKRMYKGKPASIDITTPVPVTDPVFIFGDLLKAELVAQGIESTCRALTPAVFDQQFQAGQFDVASQWSCDVKMDPVEMFTNLRSDFAKPIGQRSASKNPVRLKNPEVDKLVDQLTAIPPDSPQAPALRNQLLELYYTEMPFIPIVQQVAPQYFNTAFWTGWAAGDNIYQIPLNWWGAFVFVIGKLQPTGLKG
ncbi:ABC transporter substrate-binding protein [Nakamurella sp. DB0629]|uniref:ABC transporter substrate-binding protein n=1 Tax=Nakamurella aerolata TaxID=1656892 RepID=A0A849A036_9ACTN|nr:ABC transporter substrate-binding protein [Nakamurella aerolata]